MGLVDRRSHPEENQRGIPMYCGPETLRMNMETPVDQPQQTDELSPRVLLDGDRDGERFK